MKGSDFIRNGALFWDFEAAIWLLRMELLSTPKFNVKRGLENKSTFESRRFFLKSSSGLNQTPRRMGTVCRSIHLDYMPNICVTDYLKLVSVQLTFRLNRDSIHFEQGDRGTPTSCWFVGDIFINYLEKEVWLDKTLYLPMR